VRRTGCAPIRQPHSGTMERRNGCSKTRQLTFLGSILTPRPSHPSWFRLLTPPRTSAPGTARRTRAAHGSPESAAAGRPAATKTRLPPCKSRDAAAACPPPPSGSAADTQAQGRLTAKGAKEREGGRFLDAARRDQPWKISHVSSLAILGALCGSISAPTDGIHRAGRTVISAMQNEIIVPSHVRR
jgi:hypothetical protein